MRTSAFVLTLLAGLALLAGATGLAQHARGLSLELGPNKLVRLDESMRERLGELDAPLHLTYYVSGPQHMPPELRRLERGVVDLLEAMQRASDGLVDVRVLDPSEDPEIAAFAARRRVAPRRVRELREDTWREREIWSTLTMRYGARPPSALRGLGPEHLPRLQSLIVAQLDEMQSPRAARILLRAPDTGYTILTQALGERGELLRESEGARLAESDLLVWMDPGVVSAEQSDELERFLEEGGSVIVAGTEQLPSLDGAGQLRSLVVEPSGMDASSLFTPFGLEPVRELLLDENNAPMPREPGSDEWIPAPFRVQSIAADQDFQTMPGEPNGNLLFMTPTAIRLDEERLAAEGWSAEVLATTSDRSWTQELDSGRLPLGALAHDQGEPLPKQALLVHLTHADPWRGSFVAAASSSVFQDSFLPASGFANARLLDILLRNALSAERVVMRGAGIAPPPPLPPLSDAARLGWRALGLGAWPLLLLLPLLFARGRRGFTPSVGPRLVPRLVLGGVAGLGLIGLLGQLVDLRTDLSRDGVHSLHPASRVVAESAAGEPVEVELLLSPRSKLPLEWRRQPPLLDALLSELTDAGAPLSVRRVDVDALDEQQREAFAARGVKPVRRLSIGEETREMRTLWSALLLRRGEREELVQLPDLDAWEQLEFRLVFALQRLVTGHTPQVAFASDVPRLSAAESHEFYQKRGLMAPRGKDVYSVTRAELAEIGYDVLHVNPRRPQMPDAAPDVLVWLQPRRPVEAMTEQLVSYVRGGGRAFVAAQHFNIQSRQYRGSDFEFVYWPQPQSPDLESFWLPELGVTLERELVFDTQSFPLDLASQVSREDRREIGFQTSSQPFHVRAPAERFDPEQPLTRGLSDLPFVWPSAWVADDERLASLGLRFTPLISTSDSAWTYDWSGGWVPDEVLAGPSAQDDTLGEPTSTSASESSLIGAVGARTLVAELSGSFPAPSLAFTLDAASAPPYAGSEPALLAPGRMLLVGCSEMFKDQRLSELRTEFRPELLLYDAVAMLAFEDELVPGLTLAQLASRRVVTRGFEAPDDATRRKWRLVVPFALPALLLGLGLLTRLRRSGSGSLNA